MNQNKDLQQIKQLLDVAEANIRQAKSLLFAADINKKAETLGQGSSSAIIEGVFNGEGMIASDGKKYPVPSNYASKSKLVPGDVLKLTVLEDGTFVFKQIGPVKRKKVVGELEEMEPGHYIVRAGEVRYRVLLASVTYFKAKAGDTLTIIVPEDQESEWAAVENVLESK